MYIQPGNNSNLPTVLFVTFLLIGMGLLLYYAVDLTNRYWQLEEELEKMQTIGMERDLNTIDIEKKLAACNEANKALTEEVTKLQNDLNQALNNNAIQIGEITRLQSELDQIRNDYAALQASMNDAGHPDVENPYSDNTSQINIAGQCGGTQNAQTLLQSSILPTDPGTWIAIAIIILVAVIFQISYAIHLRNRITTRLYKEFIEREMIRRNQTSKVIDVRFPKR